MRLHLNCIYVLMLTFSYVLNKGTRATNFSKAEINENIENSIRKAVAIDLDIPDDVLRHATKDKRTQGVSDNASNKFTDDIDGTSSTPEFEPTLRTAHAKVDEILKFRMKQYKKLRRRNSGRLLSKRYVNLEPISAYPKSTYLSNLADATNDALLKMQNYAATYLFFLTTPPSSPKPKFDNHSMDNNHSTINLLETKTVDFTNALPSSERTSVNQFTISTISASKEIPSSVSESEPSVETTEIAKIVETTRGKVRRMTVKHRTTNTNIDNSKPHQHIFSPRGKIPKVDSDVETPKSSYQITNPVFEVSKLHDGIANSENLATIPNHEAKNSEMNSSKPNQQVTESTLQSIKTLKSTMVGRATTSHPIEEKDLDYPLLGADGFYESRNTKRQIRDNSAEHKNTTDLLPKLSSQTRSTIKENRPSEVEMTSKTFPASLSTPLPKGSTQNGATKSTVHHIPPPLHYTTPSAHPYKWENSLLKGMNIKFKKEINSTAHTNSTKRGKRADSGTGSKNKFGSEICNGKYCEKALQSFQIYNETSKDCPKEDDSSNEGQGGYDISNDEDKNVTIKCSSETTTGYCTEKTTTSSDLPIEDCKLHSMCETNDEDDDIPPCDISSSKFDIKTCDHKKKNNNKKPTKRPRTRKRRQVLSTPVPLIPPPIPSMSMQQSPVGPPTPPAQIQMLVSYAPQQIPSGENMLQRSADNFAVNPYANNVPQTFQTFTPPPLPNAVTPAAVFQTPSANLPLATFNLANSQTLGAQDHMIKKSIDKNIIFNAIENLKVVDQKLAEAVDPLHSAQENLDSATKCETPPPSIPIPPNNCQGDSFAELSETERAALQKLAICLMNSNHANNKRRLDALQVTMPVQATTLDPDLYIAKRGILGKEVSAKQLPKESGGGDYESADRMSRLQRDLKVANELQEILDLLKKDTISGKRNKRTLSKRQKERQLDANRKSFRPPEFFRDEDDGSAHLKYPRESRNGAKAKMKKTKKKTLWRKLFGIAGHHNKQPDRFLGKDIQNSQSSKDQHKEDSPSIWDDEDYETTEYEMWTLHADGFMFGSGTTTPMSHNAQQELAVTPKTTTPQKNKEAPDFYHTKAFKEDLDIFRDSDEDDNPSNLRPKFVFPPSYHRPTFKFPSSLKDEPTTLTIIEQEYSGSNGRSSTTARTDELNENSSIDMMAKIQTATRFAKTTSKSMEETEITDELNANVSDMVSKTETATSRSIKTTSKSMEESEITDELDANVGAVSKTETSTSAEERETTLQTPPQRATIRLPIILASSESITIPAVTTSSTQIIPMKEFLSKLKTFGSDEMIEEKTISKKVTHKTTISKVQKTSATPVGDSASRSSSHENSTEITKLTTLTEETNPATEGAESQENSEVTTPEIQKNYTGLTSSIKKTTSEEAEKNMENTTSGQIEKNITTSSPFESTIPEEAHQMSNETMSNKTLSKEFKSSPSTIEISNDTSSHKLSESRTTPEGSTQTEEELPKASTELITLVTESTLEGFNITSSVNLTEEITSPENPEDHETLAKSHRTMFVNITTGIPKAKSTFLTTEQSLSSSNVSELEANTKEITTSEVSEQNETNASTNTNKEQVIIEEQTLSESMTNFTSKMQVSVTSEVSLIPGADETSLENTSTTMNTTNEEMSTITTEKSEKASKEKLISIRPEFDETANEINETSSVTLKKTSHTTIKTRLESSLSEETGSLMSGVSTEEILSIISETQETTSRTLTSPDADVMGGTKGGNQTLTRSTLKSKETILVNNTEEAHILTTPETHETDSSGSPITHDNATTTRSSSIAEQISANSYNIEEVTTEENAVVSESREETSEDHKGTINVSAETLSGNYTEEILEKTTSESFAIQEGVVTTSKKMGGNINTNTMEQTVTTNVFPKSTAKFKITAKVQTFSEGSEVPESGETSSGQNQTFGIETNAAEPPLSTTSVTKESTGVNVTEEMVTNESLESLESLTGNVENTHITSHANIKTELGLETSSTEKQKTSSESGESMETYNTSEELLSVSTVFTEKGFTSEKLESHESVTAHGRNQSSSSIDLELLSTEIMSSSVEKQSTSLETEEGKEIQNPAEEASSTSTIISEELTTAESLEFEATLTGHGKNTASNIAASPRSKTSSTRKQKTLTENAENKEEANNATEEIVAVSKMTTEEFVTSESPETLETTTGYGKKTEDHFTSELELETSEAEEQKASSESGKSKETHKSTEELLSEPMVVTEEVLTSESTTTQETTTRYSKNTKGHFTSELELETSEAEEQKASSESGKSKQTHKSTEKLLSESTVVTEEVITSESPETPETTTGYSKNAKGHFTSELELETSEAEEQKALSESGKSKQTHKSTEEMLSESTVVTEEVITSETTETQQTTTGYGKNTKGHFTSELEIETSEAEEQKASSESGKSKETNKTSEEMLSESTMLTEKVVTSERSEEMLSESTKVTGEVITSESTESQDSHFAPSENISRKTTSVLKLKGSSEGIQTTLSESPESGATHKTTEETSFLPPNTTEEMMSSETPESHQKLSGPDNITNDLEQKQKGSSSEKQAILPESGEGNVTPSITEEMLSVTASPSNNASEIINATQKEIFKNRGNKTTSLEEVTISVHIANKTLGLEAEEINNIPEENIGNTTIFHHTTTPKSSVTVSSITETRTSLQDNGFSSFSNSESPISAVTNSYSSYSSASSESPQETINEVQQSSFTGHLELASLETKVNPSEGWEQVPTLKQHSFMESESAGEVPTTSIERTSQTLFEKNELETDTEITPLGTTSTNLYFGAGRLVFTTSPAEQITNQAELSQNDIGDHLMFNLSMETSPVPLAEMSEMPHEPILNVDNILGNTLKTNISELFSITELPEPSTSHKFNISYTMFTPRTEMANSDLNESEIMPLPSTVSNHLSETTETLSITSNLFTTSFLDEETISSERAKFKETSSKNSNLPKTIFTGPTEHFAEISVGEIAQDTIPYTNRKEFITVTSESPELWETSSESDKSKISHHTIEETLSEFTKAPEKIVTSSPPKTIFTGATGHSAEISVGEIVQDTIPYTHKKEFISVTFESPELLETSSESGKSKKTHPTIEEMISEFTTAPEKVVTSESPESPKAQTAFSKSAHASTKKASSAPTATKLETKTKASSANEEVVQTAPISHVTSGSSAEPKSEILPENQEATEITEANTAGLTLKPYWLEKEKELFKQLNETKEGPGNHSKHLWHFGGSKSTTSKVYEGVTVTSADEEETSTNEDSWIKAVTETEASTPVSVTVAMIITEPKEMLEETSENPEAENTETQVTEGHFESSTFGESTDIKCIECPNKTAFHVEEEEFVKATVLKTKQPVKNYKVILPPETETMASSLRPEVSEVNERIENTLSMEEQFLAKMKEHRLTPSKTSTKQMNAFEEVPTSELKIMTSTKEEMPSKMHTWASTELVTSQENRVDIENLTNVGISTPPTFPQGPVTMFETETGREGYQHGHHTSKIFIGDSGISEIINNEAIDGHTDEISSAFEISKIHETLETTELAHTSTTLAVARPEASEITERIETTLSLEEEFSAGMMEHRWTPFKISSKQMKPFGEFSTSELKIMTSTEEEVPIRMQTLPSTEFVTSHENGVDMEHRTNIENVGISMPPTFPQGPVTMFETEAGREGFQHGHQTFKSFIGDSGISEIFNNEAIDGRTDKISSAFEIPKSHKTLEPTELAHTSTTLAVVRPEASEITERTETTLSLKEEFSAGIMEHRWTPFKISSKQMKPFGEFSTSELKIMTSTEEEVPIRMQTLPSTEFVTSHENGVDMEHRTNIENFAISTPPIFPHGPVTPFETETGSESYQNGHYTYKSFTGDSGISEIFNNEVIEFHAGKASSAFENPKSQETLGTTEAVHTLTTAEALIEKMTEVSAESSARNSEAMEIFNKDMIDWHNVKVSTTSETIKNATAEMTELLYPASTSEIAFEETTEVLQTEENDTSFPTEPTETMTILGDIVTHAKNKPTENTNGETTTFSASSSESPANPVTSIPGESAETESITEATTFTKSPSESTLTSEFRDRLTTSRTTNSTTNSEVEKINSMAGEISSLEAFLSSMFAQKVSSEETESSSSEASTTRFKISSKVTNMTSAITGASTTAVTSTNISPNSILSTTGSESTTSTSVSASSLFPTVFSSFTSALPSTISAGVTTATLNIGTVGLNMTTTSQNITNGTTVEHLHGIPELVDELKHKGSHKLKSVWHNIVDKVKHIGHNNTTTTNFANATANHTSSNNASTLMTSITSSSISTVSPSSTISEFSFPATLSLDNDSISSTPSEPSLESILSSITTQETETTAASNMTITLISSEETGNISSLDNITSANTTIPTLQVSEFSSVTPVLDISLELNEFNEITSKIEESNEKLTNPPTILTSSASTSSSKQHTALEVSDSERLVSSLGITEHFLPPHQPLRIDHITLVSPVVYSTSSTHRTTLKSTTAPPRTLNYIGAIDNALNIFTTTDQSLLLANETIKTNILLTTNIIANQSITRNESGSTAELRVTPELGVGAGSKEGNASTEAFTDSAISLTASPNVESSNFTGSSLVTSLSNEISTTLVPGSNTITSLLEEGINATSVILSNVTKEVENSHLESISSTLESITGQTLINITNNLIGGHYANISTSQGLMSTESQTGLETTSFTTEESHVELQSFSVNITSNATGSSLEAASITTQSGTATKPFSPPLEITTSLNQSTFASSLASNQTEITTTTISTSFLNHEVNLSESILDHSKTTTEILTTSTISGSPVNLNFTDFFLEHINASTGILSSSMITNSENPVITESSIGQSSVITEIKTTDLSFTSSSNLTDNNGSSLMHSETSSAELYTTPSILTISGNPTNITGAPSNYSEIITEITTEITTEIPAISSVLIITSNVLNVTKAFFENNEITTELIPTSSMITSSNITESSMEQSKSVIEISTNPSSSSDLTKVSESSPVHSETIIAITTTPIMLTISENTTATTGSPSTYNEITSEGSTTPSIIKVASSPVNVVESSLAYNETSSILPTPPIFTISSQSTNIPEVTLERNESSLSNSAVPSTLTTFANPANITESSPEPSKITTESLTQSLVFASSLVSTNINESSSEHNKSSNELLTTPPILVSSLNNITNPTESLDLSKLSTMANGDIGSSLSINLIGPSSFSQTEATGETINSSVTLTGQSDFTGVPKLGSLSSTSSLNSTETLASSQSDFTGVSKLYLFSSTSSLITAETLASSTHKLEVQQEVSGATTNYTISPTTYTETSSVLSETTLISQNATNLATMEIQNLTLSSITNPDNGSQMEVTESTRIELLPSSTIDHKTNATGSTSVLEKEGEQVGSPTLPATFNLNPSTTAEEVSKFSGLISTMRSIALTITSQIPLLWSSPSPTPAAAYISPTEQEGSGHKNETSSILIETTEISNPTDFNLTTSHSIPSATYELSNVTTSPESHTVETLHSTINAPQTEVSFLNQSETMTSITNPSLDVVKITISSNETNFSAQTRSSLANAAMSSTAYDANLITSKFDTGFNNLSSSGLSESTITIVKDHSDVISETTTIPSILDTSASNTLKPSPSSALSEATNLPFSSLINISETQSQVSSEVPRTISYASISTDASTILKQNSVSSSVVPTVSMEVVSESTSTINSSDTGSIFSPSISTGASTAEVTTEIITSHLTGESKSNAFSEENTSELPISSTINTNGTTLLAGLALKTATVASGLPSIATIHLDTLNVGFSTEAAKYELNLTSETDSLIKTTTIPPKSRILASTTESTQMVNMIGAIDNALEIFNISQTTFLSNGTYGHQNGLGTTKILEISTQNIETTRDNIFTTPKNISMYNEHLLPLANFSETAIIEISTATESDFYSLGISKTTSISTEETYETPTPHFESVKNQETTESPQVFHTTLNSLGVESSSNGFTSATHREIETPSLLTFTINHTQSQAPESIPLTLETTKSSEAVSVTNHSISHKFHPTSISIAQTLVPTSTDLSAIKNSVSVNIFKETTAAGHLTSISQKKTLGTTHSPVAAQEKHLNLDMHHLDFMSKPLQISSTTPEPTITASTIESTLSHQPQCKFTLNTAVVSKAGMTGMTAMTGMAVMTGMTETSKDSLETTNSESTSTSTTSTTKIQEVQTLKNHETSTPHECKFRHDNKDRPSKASICSVDRMIKDLQEKALNKTLNSSLSTYMCETYIPFDHAIKLNDDRQRHRRSRRSLMFFESEPDEPKAKREIIPNDRIKTVLEKDFALKDSDSHRYAVPGSSIKIPCAEGKNFSNKQFTIKWTNGYGTALTDGNLEETGSGLLIIDNITPADGGNYTCTVTTNSSSIRVFKHELSIITLPTFEINTTILYSMKASCIDEDKAVMTAYLQGNIGHMLCGKEHKICSITIQNITCAQKDSQDYLFVSLVFRVEAMNNILPFLNSTTCGILCEMKVYAKLVSVIVHNIEVFETQPIIYHHSRNVTLTPTSTTNVSFAKTQPPKLVLGCPPGFGLMNNQYICMACGKNEYSPIDEAHCSHCPVRHYQPMAGSKSCLQCTSPFQDAACFSVMIMKGERFKVMVYYTCAVLAFIAFCSLCLHCCRHKKTPNPQIQEQNVQANIDIELQSIHKPPTRSQENIPPQRRRRPSTKYRKAPLIPVMETTTETSMLLPPNPPPPDF